MFINIKYDLTNVIVLEQRFIQLYKDLTLLVSIRPIKLKIPYPYNFTITCVIVIFLTYNIIFQYTVYLLSVDSYWWSFI